MLGKFAKGQNHSNTEEKGEIKQRGLPLKLLKMLGAEKMDNLLLNLCPKS